MDWPPYRTALRLLGVAAQYWPLIDAHYITVDLLELPMHRFLNCIYAWVYTRLEADQEKLEEWLHMLEQPLEGESPKKVTQATIDDEGASFMALLAQQGGS